MIKKIKSDEIYEDENIKISSDEIKKHSIMEFAGSWKNLDTDSIKKEIYKERKIISKRFK